MVSEFQGITSSQSPFDATDTKIHSVSACEEVESDLSTELGSDDSEGDIKEHLGFASVHKDNYETLIIFDWDDTLCPTTWAAHQGLLGRFAPDLDSVQLTLLQELTACVEQTLLLAMRNGRVVIVTNAETGWVEKSCSQLMPSLLPILEKLDILSARSEYESCAEDAPADWKRLAFVDLLEAAFQAEQWRNVISVGDSLYEHDALLFATQNMPRCFSKSVKLIENPNLFQLIEQHRLLSDILQSTVDHKAGLDVEVAPVL